MSGASDHQQRGDYTPLQTNAADADAELSSSLPLALAVPPGAVVGYLLPDGRFVPMPAHLALREMVASSKSASSAPSLSDSVLTVEPSFRLASDPMPGAFASFFCNVCAGVAAIYLGAQSSEPMRLCN